MAFLKDSIRMALGEGKVDLLIKNGRVVNVFSGGDRKGSTWPSGTGSSSGSETTRQKRSSMWKAIFSARG